MTEQEIKDGNKLIRSFMEMPKYSMVMPYNSCWDFLMPVVEKIESLYDEFHGHFGVHIYSNVCTIQGTKLRTDPENYHPAYLSDTNAMFETKLLSTWYNVLQFIKWYNEQKK